MRIFKKIVGWLAFLSLVGTMAFIGGLIYSITAPFFHGAAIYEFQPPDPSRILPLVAQALGNSQEERQILGRFSAQRVDPIAMYNGLDALEWILGHGRIPHGDSYTNVSAAAVFDRRGRILYSVPSGLEGQIVPIRVPLDQIENSTPENSARNTAPFWSSQFANVVRAHTRDVGEVYMNRVITPDGRTVALLATAGRKDPYVLTGGFDRQQVKEIGAWAIIFFALYWLLLPSWVALDAAWRGMRPSAWGILVLVMNLIGLGGYLIARLPAPGKCPNCGEKTQGKYVRCPACGEPLKANCPTCGVRMKPEWQFCPVCARTPQEAVVPPSPAQIVKPAGVLGHVVDRQLRPIPGARVFLDSDRLDRSAVTDANGCFLLADIPEGPWVVRAEADGFAPDSKLAEVSAGRQTPLNFTLDSEVKGD
jgi:hypothetical protein